MQLSGFARYSQLNYQPDAIGDLLYNGFAPWAQRTSFATGVQGDASWKVAPRHTLRGGFLVQRERVTSFAQANALPLVPDPGRSGCARHSGRPDRRHHRRLRPHRLDLQRLPAGRMEGAADAHRECRSALRCHHRHHQREPAQPARQRRLGAHAGDHPARGICPLLRSRPVEPGLRRRDRGARRHDRRHRGHDQRPGARRTLRQHRHRPDGEAGRWPHHRLQRLLQVGRELPRQGPVRRTGLPDRLQLLERPGARLRALRQLRQGPVVALRQPRLVAGQLDQHHLGPVQLRAGGAGLHRQQLDLRRPQPELDRLGRCRLRVQHGQRLGDPGLGRRPLRQRPAPDDRDAERRGPAGLCHAQPVGDAAPADQRQQGHQRAVRRHQRHRRPVSAAQPEPASAWARLSSACAGRFS